VDASPEHLRPRFDGGTGVRTVATISSCMGSLYPHFGEERYPALRFGDVGAITSPTKGRGSELFKVRSVFIVRETND
jgi:hypothetical protein